MDEQRGDKSFDYLKPLHYVNVEKGDVYDKGATNNILAEIYRILKDFQNLNALPDETIRMDLYELFHLIGDLHQPLHVGYGSDKGGNQYQVQFDGNGSNLHKVWDSQIIEHLTISLSDIEKSVTVQKNEPVDIYKWFNENRTYLDKIYPSGHKIDQEYIEQNTPIIKQQLANAGTRLADILEKYFKNFSREPKFKKIEVVVKDINIDQIGENIGQTVKICTKIFGTKELANITFLNCGAAYPNSPITAVVFKDDMSNFKNNPAQYYNGKKVCITGKIEVYKGKAEIILKNESQIEIK